MPRTFAPCRIALAAAAFLSAATLGANAETTSPTPTPPHRTVPVVPLGSTERLIPRRTHQAPDNGTTGPTLVKLAPGNVWTQSIRSAPVATNSAGVASYIAESVQENYGGVAAFNANSYNVTFYRVPPGTRRVDVRWTDCQNLNWTPKGVYTEASHFAGVPVPENAVAASGTDGAMAIYDPQADKIWEFWKMAKNSTTGRWEACWGGRLDRASTQQGQFPYPFGVSASGLVMSAGVISIAEVTRGRIDHAMYLGVVGPAHWKNYSWPANRSDGYSTDPNAPLEGQRLRLDPTLDLDKLQLTKVGRMVAEAAQTYGFIVSDKAGAVGVATESGKPMQMASGANPWDRLLGGPSYTVLRNFPWDKIQALPKDYGKPAS